MAPARRFRVCTLRLPFRGVFRWRKAGGATSCHGKILTADNLCFGPSLARLLYGTPCKHKREQPGQPPRQRSNAHTNTHAMICAKMQQAAPAPCFTRARAAVALLARMPSLRAIYMHVCTDIRMCALDRQKQTCHHKLQGKTKKSMQVATHPPFGGRSAPPNNLGGRQDAR